MKKRIYIVTVYRWSSNENHSYVIGAFSSFEKAEKAGDDERIQRGGIKYFPEIVSFEIDNMKSKKVDMYLGEQV